MQQTLLQLSTARNKTNTIVELLQTIEREKLVKLKSRPVYWQAKSLYLQSKNVDDRRLTQHYQRALTALPDNNNLKASYLRHLAREQQHKLLRFTVHRFQDEAFAQQPMNSAFIDAFKSLGEYRQALRIHHMIPDSERDYRWWLNEAAILEILGHNSRAYKARQISWLMLYNIHFNTGDMSGVGIANALNISQRLAPIQVQMGLIQHLQVPLTSTQAGELGSWALTHDSWPILNAMYDNRALLQQTLPAWLSMNVALNRHDHTKVYKLLQAKGSSTQLTPMMRARGYRATNNWRQAKKWSYQALDYNRSSRNAKDLFDSIMLNRANRVEINTYWRMFGNLAGSWHELSLVHWVANNWQIKPMIKAYQTMSSNKNLLRVPFDAITEGAVQLTYSTPAITRRIKAGIWNAIFAQPSFEFSERRQFYPWLSAYFQAGYNQMSEENSLMLLAGKQHELTGELQERPMPRNTITQRLRERIFYSQDNTYLGHAQNAYLGYSHNFRVNYPNWNLSLFTEYYNYVKNGRVGKTLTQVIPEQVSARADSFLSDDFAQFGTRFGWAQADMNQYVSYWRTFMDTSVFYQTVLGLGYYGIIGISGPVFGDDHMVLYLADSKNQQIITTDNRRIGVKYQVYY